MLNLTPGHLLAMVDALQKGTLDGAQGETAQGYRLLSWIGRAKNVRTNTGG